MFRWITHLFKRETISVIDNIVIERSELTNPILKPNDTMYQFPDPLSFKAAPLCQKKKRRKKQKKK